MFHVCQQCNALFVPQNQRGRPSSFCGDRCQNRYYYLRRVRTSGRPCAACGKPMSVTRTSAPEGRARCLPCRRAARGLEPEQLYRDAVKAGLLNKNRGPRQCRRCSKQFESGRRLKFCSEECARKDRYARGSGSKPSTSARGYGSAHQKLRAEMLPLAYGTPCHFCAVVMREGDYLHLDHTEDRVGYRGMVHAACNLRDGSRRGGEAGRRARLERGWRPGQDPSLRQKVRR